MTPVFTVPFAWTSQHLQARLRQSTAAATCSVKSVSLSGYWSRQSAHSASGESRVPSQWQVVPKMCCHRLKSGSLQKIAWLVLRYSLINYTRCLVKLKGSRAKSQSNTTGKEHAIKSRCFKKCRRYLMRCKIFRNESILYSLRALWRISMPHSGRHCKI